jgi:hypothetical protein
MVGAFSLVGMKGQAHALFASMPASMHSTGIADGR